MRYSEWSDRMAAAGYKTTISEARALLARLPEPELARLLADNAAWRDARQRYKHFAKGKRPRWHDSDEAIVLAEAAQAARVVMIEHCRVHKCHYQAFLTALDHLADARPRTTATTVPA